MKNRACKIAHFIDEDSKTKMLFSKMMQQMPSVKTMYFSRAEEALLSCCVKPDFVFIDYSVNKRKGMKYLPYFRRTLPSAKIFLMSKQHDVSIFELALSRGADLCLLKDRFSLAEAFQEIVSSGENRDQRLLHRNLLSNYDEGRPQRPLYILDNNINFAFSLKNALKKSPQYKVQLFNNSNALFSQCNKDVADVVLLDCAGYDCKSGPDIVLELKALSAKTEVVIISTLCDLSMAARLMRSGASYIMKKSEANLHKINAVLRDLHVSPYEKALHYIKNANLH